MLLYLIRHAIAEEPREDLDDAARKLTSVGREKFADVVAGLCAMDAQFRVILHSPKTRAVETAAMLKPLCSGKLVQSKLLAEEPEESILTLLSQNEAMAAVGHQPYLSQLAGLLAFGPKSKGGEVSIKKGGVVVLEGVPKFGGMQILGVYAPGDFRLMAAAKRSKDSQRRHAGDSR